MPDIDLSSTEPSRRNPQRDQLDALLRPPLRPPWWTWRPTGLAERAPNLPRAAFGMVIALMVAGGLVAYRSMTSRPVEVELPRAVAPGPSIRSADLTPKDSAAPDGSGASVSSSPPVSVVVQVAGAVRAPGVVTIAPGARWNDALVAAGGPSPDADVDRVNLAAVAVDGARLFVPRRGEEPPGEIVATAAAARPGGDDAPTASHAAPIDLNAATAEQLDALPGVGPSTAAAILEYRERSGPFRSVDELDEVSGIGPTRLERLRPLVRV